jgi:hypothetical protein
MTVVITITSQVGKERRWRMVKLTDDDYRHIEYIQMETNRMYGYYGICGFSVSDRIIHMTEDMFLYNFWDYNTEEFDTKTKRYYTTRNGFTYFAFIPLREPTFILASKEGGANKLAELGEVIRALKDNLAEKQEIIESLMKSSEPISMINK